MRRARPGPAPGTPAQFSLSELRHNLRTLQAELPELVPQAPDIWQRTELHFGKEESVYRPRQQTISQEEFRPVVAAQDEAFGWLREHGWER